MQIGLLSSFPPSNSGIAEFTDDFENALKQSNNDIIIQRIALEDPSIASKTDSSFLCIIQKERIEDYIHAAEIINASSIEILIIQHEFATYGGPNGEYIVKLIHRIKKPIILIAHTVPVADDAHHIIERKQFFQAIYDSVNNIIVFLPQAKKTLVSYGLEEDKISIIPHGVKSMKRNEDILKLRQKFCFPEDAFILFSFGFFHPNKGTIYTIQAINSLVKKKKNVFFLYAGTTLPSADSQEYFKSLREMVQNNHLEKNVRFDMNFISQDRLSAYLHTCDVGIVPYIYKSYTASGPLSFFIGAGKPIITTPFAYATSILSSQDACFVPFKNGSAIAQAITRIQSDQEFHNSLITHYTTTQSTLLWKSVAQQYLSTIKNVLEQHAQ